MTSNIVDESTAPGLYRDTRNGARALVYIGWENGAHFTAPLVHAHRNRWSRGEPRAPLHQHEVTQEAFVPLPAEGFYTLPETLEFGGCRWLCGAIVQLGYNEHGDGLVFVAEWEVEPLKGGGSTLHFGSRGKRIDDALLRRLVWAPVLPVQPVQEENG